MDEKAKILLCCTGSVAAIKIPDILNLLLNQNSDINNCRAFEVKIIATEKATHFFSKDSLKDLYPQVEVYSDSDEWSTWRGRGDPVLHIDLTKWADLLLIAPLDANTMGKIASGICDNMLTSAIRAWDVDKPLLFCPAMNTKMWNHPITIQQINQLNRWGYTEIPCISKTLMCGDSGIGAMAEPENIYRAVVEKFDVKR